MPALHRFSVPIPLVFGPGALAELPEALRRLRVSRPLVVTDRGLRDCGILDRALRALGGLRDSAAVFDAVSSNPTEGDVLGALSVWSAQGCDGIVALGGGSAIDAAKAVRLLASHPGTITDYDLLCGGMDRISRPMPPLVAVPTTAGTGSEVSRAALIVTRRGQVVRKTAVASPALVPSMALLDPELTSGLPPQLTAGTAMDALSHAVEEYLSPRYHPVVAALAASALTTIARALTRVWRTPSDLDARGDMLMAAMTAGIGFEKGLGVVHSLSHAIGALHDLHHGTLNAVLLSHAIEFNRAHIAPGAARDLALAAGLPAASDGTAVDALAKWFRGLNTELGIPLRLRDLADLSQDRDEILARAQDDHCHRTNPRPCGPQDFQELWERAL